MPRQTPRKGRLSLCSDGTWFKMPPMRNLLAISFLVLPFAALGGFYKWQGPDGQTYYSDRPVPGAEPLGLKVERTAEAADAQGEDDRPVGDPGPYEDFTILVPEPNQTVRDADGKALVSLLINPALAADSRLEILLDGQPLPGTTREAQIQLHGVSVGSHRIQARILDEANEVVASSPVVDFHMRKPLPEDATP